jgi:hypothetical protein
MKSILIIFLFPVLALAQPDCQAEARLWVTEWRDQVRMGLTEELRISLAKVLNLRTEDIVIKIALTTHEFWRQESHATYMFQGQTNPILVRMADGATKIFHFSSAKGFSDPFADTKLSVHIWTDLKGQKTYDQKAQHNGWKCLFELHADASGVVYDSETNRPVLNIKTYFEDKRTTNFPL